jgi:hypothetical protein
MPTYNGLMSFPAIQGPDGPEEFSWEVELGPEQELRQVDATHAGVFWSDETKVMSIEAEKAHAADGATVPTTLTVTQPNVITLTVHHRSAPFVYPVSSGVGWEGGFKTEEAIVMPGDQPAPPPTCVVPDLSNRTLRASRKILHAAHCRLGRVRGERNRAVHVVEQFRQVGKVLPVWTRIDVKTLPAAQYSRSS